MKSRRRSKKFWKHLFTLFAIYAAIVPLVFLVLDSKYVSKHFNKDPWGLLLQFAGIALGIALIISFWFRKDPELRQW